MECATDTRSTDAARAGLVDRCALVPLLPDGRPISPRRRDPRDNPFDGVRRGSTDYCRQARRLRALYARRPILLHEQLSQLKVQDPPETERPAPASSDRTVIERLDALREDHQTSPAVEFECEAPEPDGDHSGESESSVEFVDSTPWTGLNGAKVGKRGVSVLSRLRDKLMAAPALPPTAAASPSRSGSFADYAAERITGPVLAYADRLALLREAGRRGIGRFEANLVIAAVQHRMGDAPPHVRPAPPRFRGLLRTLALFGMIQTAILIGLWHVLH